MSNKFTIAIIGRPNTGKSTLFNLLAGFKKSIIDPLPGVTRDLLHTEVTIDGKQCMIIDTGGLFNDTNDELNKLVHARSVSILSSAGVVIFLCDINEFLPIDKEIARLLHRICESKVVLVLNKADNLRKKDYESERSDFYQFGFDTTFLISAAHNLGISELKEHISSLITDEPMTADEPAEIKICIVGKPNVGKSSILNKLAGTDLSIVYDKPGTTRDPVDTVITYHNRKIRIIDTAGMRKKGKVNEDVEYYSVNRAVKTLRNCDIGLLIIDAREGITEQDRKIVELTREAGRGLLIVANKWDLIDKNKFPTADFMRGLREIVTDLEHIPIVTISALTGQRVRELLDYIMKIYENQYKRVETGFFNRFLKEMQKGNSIAPMLKVYFGTQVKVNPPIFQIFVNNKKYLSQTRERFILNKLMEKIDLTGVFPVLQVKSKKKKDKDAD